MTKARRFAGKHPKSVEPVTAICDDNGKTWLLYRLTGRDSPDGRWHNYKLCVVDRAPRKANYRLGWSPSQKRIADSKQSYALDEHRPELYDGVLAYLEFCT